mmetsp:Transcript_3603/g.10271  ORF Transcript_3603/g.10271 Transcript_3603/m.10271 type:complete len:201 (+) Transcript_3603:1532-2134(+)
MAFAVHASSSLAFALSDASTKASPASRASSASLHLSSNSRHLLRGASSTRDSACSCLAAALTRLTASRACSDWSSASRNCATTWFRKSVQVILFAVGVSQVAHASSRTRRSLLDEHTFNEVSSPRKRRHSDSAVRALPSCDALKNAAWTASRCGGAFMESRWAGRWAFIVMPLVMYTGQPRLAAALCVVAAVCRAATRQF